jgi:predicted nuclease with TOPRIM domain
MINKLRFGEERILSQVISKLELASTIHKKNNQTAREISQGIAGINSKLMMLDQLHSKGYLAADVYQAQARELRNQLSALKADRQDSFENRITEMLTEVRKLQALLDEIEEPLEEFDEKLFFDTVVDMTINKKDEMTITLIGGLGFTELI